MTSFYYNYQNTLVCCSWENYSYFFQTSPGLTNLNRKAKAKRNPVVLVKCILGDPEAVRRACAWKLLSRLFSRPTDRPWVCEDESNVVILKMANWFCLTIRKVSLLIGPSESPEQNLPLNVFSLCWFQPAGSPSLSLELMLFQGFREWRQGNKM